MDASLKLDPNQPEKSAHWRTHMHIKYIYLSKFSRSVMKIIHRVVLFGIEKETRKLIYFGQKSGVSLIQQ
jgi:hypothetical protein